MSPRASLFHLFESIEDREARHAAVYADFYEQFGPDAYLESRVDERLAVMLGGRVLHCDQPEDRSIHVVAYGPATLQYWYNLRRTDTNGMPYHHLQYDPSQFRVFTTNGVQTEQWVVESAHGDYNGRFNEIERRYNAELETRHFRLVSQDGTNRQLLTIGATGLHGHMTLENGHLGWLLDAEESAAERERVLRVVHQPLGEAALAA